MQSTLDTSIVGAKRPLESDASNAAPAAKQPKTTKAAARKSAAVGFCSLNKKDFGDTIKECFRLEKYDVQRMTFTVQMDVHFFRNFFVAPGTMIVPPAYDETTPVVVATLGNRAAGETFGVSKIKNGNRMKTVNLSLMTVVFYPPTQQAQVWVSI
ncbi:hypothetical protein BD626DRAFT_625884 [Schizophyllum amplum]|uniref:Uncharacterized protein n=1 Tax=Schizophyllum amplum TaxID=97359 RepID=A0A550CRK9_9AGAR|nr:hypothetical protein BD626DRAFT_625884 [Auriculariopsis ampla]